LGESNARPWKLTGGKKSELLNYWEKALVNDDKDDTRKRIERNTVGGRGTRSKKKGGQGGVCGIYRRKERREFKGKIPHQVKGGV